MFKYEEVAESFADDIIQNIKSGEYGWDELDVYEVIADDIVGVVDGCEWVIYLSKALELVSDCPDDFDSVSEDVIADFGVFESLSDLILRTVYLVLERKTIELVSGFVSDWNDSDRELAELGAMVAAVL